MRKKRNFLKIFKVVQLLLLDVDGVLTNEEIIYDNEGRELKIFNVKDGLGIFILNKLGIKTILVSAKDSPILRMRAKDFGAEVIGGILPKESILDKIQEKYGVEPKNMCFIGDDIIDLGIMRRVGVPVAVANACKEVKDIALYVSTKEGGKGAVREVVELILKAQGKWEYLVKNMNSLLLT